MWFIIFLCDLKWEEFYIDPIANPNPIQIINKLYEKEGKYDMLKNGAARRAYDLVLLCSERIKCRHKISTMRIKSTYRVLQWRMCAKVCV
jgi:hypothetical protein